jgi:hypothetical protein
MPIMNLPATFTPIQIDVVAPKKGPQKDVPIARSCTGALYLRPGPMFLTKDELEYIKRARPEVHGAFSFIALSKEERAEIQAKEKPVDMPESSPAEDRRSLDTPEKARKEKTRGA